MPLTNETATENDFKEIAETNFQRINAKISKAGYVDGVADGRDSVFQSGFDQGYADGFRTGFEVEKHKAFYKHLPADNLQNEDLLNEKTIYNAMQLPETRAKEHFQYLNHKEESLESISKHQQKYVDELVEKCAKKLPVTTNLLAAPQEKQ